MGTEEDRPALTSLWGSVPNLTGGLGSVEYVRRQRDAATPRLSPARGVLIVKPIETQESLPGSCILLTENARKDWAQWQMEVVAVGRPAICKKPERCMRRHGETYYRGELLFTTHDADDRLSPGAWVIVKPRSTLPISSDSPEVIVRQEDVVAVFKEAP